MHQDNKPYLISLCSLMSQLKGLVLPLAMRLAERIVCRLVSAGLWRFWSTFKMPASDVGSCMCVHIGVPDFHCQVTGVPHNGWHHYKQKRYTVILIISDKPVVQAKSKNEHGKPPKAKNVVTLGFFGGVFLRGEALLFCC